MAKKKKKVNPSGYTPAEVRQLHRRGFSVAGHMPGVADALQPRTSKFLRDQARKTLGLAYRPAEKALSERESRVKAIRDKRTRDHQAFQAWQVQQQAILRSEAETRRTTLLTQMQQQQSDLTNSLLQVTQQAQSRLAAGGVQGGIDSGVVAPAQRAAIESSAAKISAVSSSGARGADYLAATQANNQLAMKALEARDFARSMEELSDVADDRTKLQLQKGADTAKQLAHLFDMEVEKAQQNQQLQLAGQKLGVQLQGIQAGIEKNKRTTEATKRGQDLTFAAATRQAMIAADNAAETLRHNRAQERLARKKLAATDPTGASKQERAARTASIREVNRMRAYMIDKLGKAVGKIGGKTSKGKNKDDFNEVIQTLREQYPNSADLMLVAYDLWRFGKLRPGARKRWHSEYGYAVPKGW